jgi:hypothetical protein
MAEVAKDRPWVMRNLVQAEFGLTGTRTITFEAEGDGSGRHISPRSP